MTFVWTFACFPVLTSLGLRFHLTPQPWFGLSRRPSVVTSAGRAEWRSTDNVKLR